ncbi:hypothetical protein, conserved [Leishmania tarentolae]|uniref:Uncharacterized protein n=1 Tax=Leishmania tarentolae TaxID=5689 RepID=A0A640KCS3_LEITA|nr:hypothetical protein, conserved [Leishmania tarentolae]
MAANSSAVTTAEPGDRYLTREPCCLQCCHRDSSALVGPLAGSLEQGAATCGDAELTFPSAAATGSSVVWIALRPYSYLFRAPVKGRWLGRGLLELFLQEFAFVPFDTTAIASPTTRPLAQEIASADATSGAIRSAVVPLLLQRRMASMLPSSTAFLLPSTCISGGATLDRRFTLPAYIEELCEGVLWLRDREAECRTAGHLYRKALIDAVAHMQLSYPSAGCTGGGACKAGISGELETQPHSQQQQMGTSAQAISPVAALCEIPSSEKNAAASEWAAWCRTVLWLADLSSEAEVDAVLQHVLLAASRSPSGDSSVAQITDGAHTASAAAARMPLPLLSLQQRDIVCHRVWRREGRMFGHSPLEIIRFDVAAACLDMSSAQSKALAMVVVNKPPGLPVHPSGCYRKNSVTSILEDVLGGGGDGDARRFYRIEEHYATAATEGTLSRRPYASIVHKEGGFELIRVWLRRTPCPMDASAVVTDDPSSGFASADEMGVAAEDWAVLKTLFMRRSEETTQRTEPSDLQRGGGLGRHGAMGLAGDTGRDVSHPGEVKGCDDRQSSAKVSKETTTTVMHASMGDAAVAVPPSYKVKVFVVHRLDAATSGVLLLGLSSHTARRTAAAIANKALQEGGGNDGECALTDDVLGGRDMRGGAASETPLSSLPTSSSLKVYCARVHGRVDLERLARRQHHCILRTPSSQPQRTSDRLGAPDAAVSRAHASSETHDDAAAELLVCRPIGCLDHHNSLYWSPDVAVTDWWQRHEADTKQQQQQEYELHSSPPSRRQGKRCRPPEAVAAKHERMRQLTRGGGEVSVDTLASVLQPVHGVEAAPPARERATNFSDGHGRVQQYCKTLRAAETALRVMHYDVATDQTVMKCTLGTGRTHQLRVHLASLGHPIVHDSKYIALEAHMRNLAKDSKYGMAESSEVTPTTAVPGTPLASEASLIHFYESNDTAGSTEDCGRTPAGGAGMGRWPSEVFAESRNVRGCVCPESIDLHAWRYTLVYDDGEALSVEAPLPPWAHWNVR